jgi:hypothetical protein
MGEMDSILAHLEHISDHLVLGITALLFTLQE